MSSLLEEEKFGHFLDPCIQVSSCCHPCVPIDQWPRTHWVSSHDICREAVPQERSQLSAASNNARSHFWIGVVVLEFVIDNGKAEENINKRSYNEVGQIFAEAKQGTSDNRAEERHGYPRDHCWR